MNDDDYTWEDFESDLSLIPVWMGIGAGMLATLPFIAAGWLCHKVRKALR